MAITPSDVQMFVGEREGSIITVLAWPYFFASDTIAAHIMVMLFIRR